MRVTAETITDEQIAEVRRDAASWLDDNGFREGTKYDEYSRRSLILYHARVALGLRRARKGGSKAKSRARCADTWNETNGAKP